MMDKTKELEEQYDKIYRYCYFKVRDPETAEDITQETFLRFLENKRRAGFAANLPYLYTVARNLCIDEYRRRREEPLEEETPAEPSAGIEEAAVARLSMEAALDKLAQDDKELLLLRYANGVPVSAISTITGKSRFCVYRNLQRIKKELAEAIGEEELR